MRKKDSVAIVACESISDFSQLMIPTPKGDALFASKEAKKVIAKRFRIPPIYRNSLPDVLLKTLYVTERALLSVDGRDAGFPRKNTDVFFAGGFPFEVNKRNSLRIKAFEYASDDREFDKAAFNDLIKHLQGTFVDKLYELSASIASQIAVSFKFQGKIQSFDVGDLSVAGAMEDAYKCLLYGHSEAAVVCVGQGTDSMPAGIRGLERVSEGYGCVILMRESDAVRQGLPLLGILRHISSVHELSHDVFRHLRDGKMKAMWQSSLASSETRPEDVRHVLIGVNDQFVSEERRLFSQLLGTEIHATPVNTDTDYQYANTFLHQIYQTLQLLQSSDKDASTSRRKKTDSIAVNAIGRDGGWAHSIISLPKKRLRPFRRIKPTAFEPIAIVGIGNRYGLGNSPDVFHHNASQNVNCLQPYREFPDTLLNRKGIHDLDRSYTTMVSRISLEYHKMRANLSASEWNKIDPAQRLAIELAYDSLRDAGEKPLNDTQTGIFIGCNQTNTTSRILGAKQYALEVEGEDWARFLENEEWQRWLEEHTHHRRDYTDDAMYSHGLPRAIAKSLGLESKAVSVHAACASSLAAIDQACRALSKGDIGLAIAGGVELGANLYELVLCSRMQLLSQNQITPFDVGADGFSIGEGGALFTLKTMSRALESNDKIYAVIRGIGASCDANSMMAPCSKGQSLAMQRAYECSGISPEEIDVLEMHGTGTAKGDVVEYEAVDRIFRIESRKSPLYMSSVKSMIGHTMAAAGAAGTLRAAMSLYTKDLPTTANINELNPQLQSPSHMGVFPTETTKWTQQRAKRKAAVNCFGTGGINYHMILEESESA